MNKLLLILPLLVSINSFAAKQAPKVIKLKDVYRSPGEKINEKSYEINIDIDYFQKSASYDLDGNSVAMDEGDAFTLMDSEFSLKYGYGRNLELLMGGKWRQVVSQTATTDLKNSGMESFFGGAKYSFSNVSRWKYALEFQFRQTSYSNSEFTAGQAPNDEIILGDSGTEATFTAHASYYISKNHVFSTSFGYNMPPAELSHELVYDVHMAWPYSRFAMLLGIRGVQSLGQDEFADSPATKPSVNSGVTSKFNSINRQVAEPYLGINIAFQSFKVELKGAQTIAGASTDEGMTVSFGLSFGSSGVTSKQRKLTKFKEYLVEATIIKLSPRGKFVKIDKGVSADVEKGMRFDIFKSDFFGGNELVASGSVYELGSDWAIVRLEKLFKQTPIEKGFTARGF